MTKPTHRTTHDLSEDEGLVISYETLRGMSGEKCYTLTADNPADMLVDDQKVTVIFSSGRSIKIPREMIVEAISILKEKKHLTVADVYKITRGNAPRTDKVMGILRKLPGVTFERLPRALHYQDE